MDETDSTPGIDRREEPRTPLTAPVVIEVPAANLRCQGEMVNLSAHGLGLRYPGSIDCGETVHVRIQMDGVRPGHLPEVVTGRVVWVDTHGEESLVGIRLDHALSSDLTPQLYRAWQHASSF
jgi:hypothetical protein